MAAFHHFFIFIHCNVGTLEHILKTHVAALIKSGKAKRDTNWNFNAFVDKRLIAGLFKPTEQCIAIFQIVVLQNHHKFVTANAEHETLAENIGNQLSRRNDQIVANPMTILIVRLFQIVDI